MTDIKIQTPSWFASLHAHWPIYLIEATLLGLFMVSACAFTALFEFPTSPAHRAIASPFVRRSLIGAAMGLTAVALIYCPWGKRSGAHMNPAVTASFLWMGKIERWDAVFYVIAQFIGGGAGVLISRAVARQIITHPAVNDVVTVPGPYGVWPAWVGEFVISFLMMAMIIGINRFPRLVTRTGYFAGLLVALYITFEAPFSGMSINPARTFGSAIVAGLFTAIWVYFTAPVLGMLTAVEVHRILVRHPHTLCGKFTHSRHMPCIFPCTCLRSSDDHAG